MRAAINAKLVAKGRQQLKELAEVWEDPMKHNTDLLMQILRDNENTEWGVKNNFKDVHSIEDFQRIVPITEYTDYASSVERMVAGEKNVLTAETPIHYSLTSGTTGKPKYIALTPKGEAFREYFGLLMATASETTGTDWFSGSAIDVSQVSVRELPTGATVGSYSARMIKSMAPILTQLSNTPICVQVPLPGTDCSYLQALFGLADKETVRISGYYFNTMLFWFQSIENNWEMLVNDIEAGTINESVKMPQETRETLSKMFKANPERAAELRAIFKSGFDEPFAPRVWPRLTYITGIGGGSFKISEVQMRQRYLGPKVAVNCCMISASEADIALAPTANTFQMALLPKHTFYEFQLASDSNAPWVTMDKLKEGEEYEVMITTFAGFYRYRLFDILRVVGFKGKTPMVEFMYRKGCYLNICGEKVNEEQVQDAISLTKKELNVDICEFSISQYNAAVPGYYIVYMENKLTKSQPFETLQTSIHNSLKAVNAGFVKYFTGGYIAHTQLRLLRDGAYELYRTLRIAQGSTMNQCKPLRLATTDLHNLFLEELVVGNGELDALALADRVANGPAVLAADEVKAKKILDAFQVAYELK